MKIKNNFSFLIPLFLFSSCTVYMYQLQEVQSTDPKTAPGTIDYHGEHLNVFYNFWEENRSFSCIIENTSDSLIFIDLNLSHFVLNSFAYPYFNNTAKLNTLSWTNNSHPFYNNLTFDVSMIKTEDKILVIPPHSKKVLNTYKFLHPYNHCDLSLNEDSSSVSFDISNSPLIFSNRFYYTIDNNSKRHEINNEFYLAKIDNLSASKLWSQKPKNYQCSVKPTGEYLDYSPKEAKNRYYFRSN